MSHSPLHLDSSSDTQSLDYPLNVYGLSESDLTDHLLLLKQPRFRVKQICQWIYEKGITSFEEMSNLPKTLRAHLTDHFYFGHLHLAVSQSAKDGTEKRLYTLPDGEMIESVLMLNVVTNIVKLIKKNK